ncbi:MAG: formylglycine-generating enzyme family protein [Acetobacteraceae bacterium]|nr:formylglycine-generating enzyme family protein [Acetobacteraceae bacterium]
MTGLKALGGMIDTDLPEAAWADDTGRDNFGPWASFTVKPKDGGPVVTQRLRWIPPGAFRMGSPPDEEGHRNNEFQGPEIVFAQGFWLFDTPCAQALWMAVMGPENNPSRFEGNPDRPVEMVSFRDVDRFIRAVNGLKPGLDLSLPSEAQWEYACRAGTTDAIYAGPATIGGKANVDVLNRIAWWSGNSGRETHPVGEKEPNLWGLHDMLGNVWEWCADAYHTGHRGAPRDGTVGGTADNAAGRVVRGGSSGGSARSVRAASRGGGAPSARGDNLGFRCARGPLK